MDKIHARIQESVYTKAEWEAANPVLLKGEKGFVSDDPNLFKIGDGVTAWNSLPWRGYTGTITQVTGDNENAVMSQKATVAAIQAEAQERNEADEQLNTAIEVEKNRAQAAEQAIIYDVSSHNNGAVFESISALLNNSNLDTLIPVSVRHGGMTIRFIQGYEPSSDNNYIQARLMANEFTTDVTKWQGVDDEPTAGSDNLVKSGGVESSIEHTALEITGAIDDNWFVTGNVPYYRVSDGVALINNERKRTILFKVAEGDIFHYRLNQSNTVYMIAAFDSGKNFLSDKSVAGNMGWAEGDYTVDSTVAYVQFCCLTSSEATVKKTNAKYSIAAQIEDLQKHDLLDGCYTCSTVAKNSAKSLAITGFKLFSGGGLKVKFEHATSSQNCTLNISQTGAKPFYYEGQRAGSYNTWADNEVVLIYYDATDEIYYGTKYDCESHLIKAYLGYFVCDSVAGSPNKVINNIGFSKLLVGGSFKVKFLEGINTSSTINLILNSGSSLSKPIYYEDAPASTSNSWAAGEVVEVFYDGEKFNVYKAGYGNKIKAIDTRVATVESKALEHTYSHAETATLNTLYRSIVETNIPANRLFKVYFSDNTPGYVADLFVRYAGSSSYTYIKAYPVGNGNVITAKFATAIIGVRLDISAANVVNAGTSTVVVDVYNQYYSDAISLVEGVFRTKVSVTPSSTFYANPPLPLVPAITAGKKVVFKAIDPEGALNNVDVIFYAERNFNNPLATIKPNTVSNVVELSSTLEWLYCAFRQASGVSYGTGTITFEIHVESNESDTIFNSLYNIQHNSPSGAAASEYSVNIKNPYWEKCMTGNQSQVETRNFSGIFVKFDEITIYNGNLRIIKSWSDVLTDTGKTGSTSGGQIPNCLLLSIGGTYHQGLAYDLKTNKFVVFTDTLALADGNYIYLAYSKQGNGCGHICEQYDHVMLNNQSVYLKEVRRNYRNTLRTKQMELLESKDFFTFGLCSDVHYPMVDDGGEPINVTNAVMSDIDKYIGLDAILNGGDNILYGTKYKSHGLEGLYRQFQTIDLDKFIPCAGNHDYNGVGDGVTIQEDDWTVTDKELGTLFFRRCKATNRPTDKLYYYRDFDEKKVRIIVLNTQDVPVQFDNEGKVVYDPLTLFGISQQQMNFIVSALHVSAKTDAEDWKIMFLMHVGLYSNDDTPRMYGNGSLINRVVLRNILKAFVNRTTYSYSETDTDHDGIFTISGSVDFTSAVGKLIAVFNGHTHHDCYVNADGFNCIGIQCSYPNATANEAETEYSLPAMLAGTYDEFAIDVVILDDTQQKIILKRFGHHHSIQNPTGDREYSYDVTI